MASLFLTIFLSTVSVAAPYTGQYAPLPPNALYMGRECQIPKMYYLPRSGTNPEWYVPEMNEGRIGFYGTFKIRGIKMVENCFYSNNNQVVKDISNEENAAAVFFLNGDQRVLFITDHVKQGYGNLYKVNPGTDATLTTADGKTCSYVCIRKDEDGINDDNIKFSNGTNVLNHVPNGSIVLYTCNHDAEEAEKGHITILVFVKKVDLLRQFRQFLMLVS